MLIRVLGSGAGFKVPGSRSALTDVDLRFALDVALRAVEPGFVGIEAVDDGSVVVYAVLDESGSSSLFARVFDFDEEGGIVLDGEREEVRAETSYVPLHRKLMAAQARLRMAVHPGDPWSGRVAGKTSQDVEREQEQREQAKRDEDRRKLEERDRLIGIIRNKLGSIADVDSLKGMSLEDLKRLAGEDGQRAAVDGWTISGLLRGGADRRTRGASGGGEPFGIQPDPWAKAGSDAA